MSKTYNKEIFNESVKKLDDLVGNLACKSIFWTVATGFAIWKLVNAIGCYGVAIGRRDTIRINMDDMKESEDN